jgi:CRISPR-associated exonuclease Cas4
MPGSEPDTAGDNELLPLSALNHLLYCERRCALIHVEGVFVENVYTLEGSLAHEAADTPGYETSAGVRVVRALPLYSKQLGLVGKADIVEFRGETPYPVDYKRGKRKKWVNDDVQLCAQALCLEEMMASRFQAAPSFTANPSAGEKSNSRRRFAPRPYPPSGVCARSWMQSWFLRLS